MAYPTLEQLKTHMAITGDTLDNELTIHLDAAIDFAERHCSRSFVESSETKVFPVRAPFVNQARRRLMVFQSFTSVTTLTNGDGVVITSGQYDLLPYNGPVYHGLLLRPGAAFNDGGSGTPISLAAAWGVGTPDSVFLAIMQLADFLYKSGQQGSGGAVQGSSRQSGVTVLASEIPQHVQIVLDAWKRAAV